jgi:predicted HTH transcriptional regulator
MKDFIRDARASRGFAIRETATASQLLTHLNLLDDGRPTHAAVLVFGRTPQQFLPSSEIKCAHFHGVDVAKPIPSYQVYKGTVFALVDQAVDFVMSRLALSVGTRAVIHAGGAKAPVAYEIPREVVAEGIVNAVAHRDYGNNGSVQVMLFSDRLEIWNPGSLPDSLPVARLREPHGSIPHNPLIAEPMYLTQYIERLGTGVGDMIRRCREAGLREPSYKVTDGIRLTIWRDGRYSAANSSGKRPVESSGKRPGKTLGEMGLQIVASIQEQPNITIVEIAQRLGRTARGVEKQIRLLREAEIIGRVGPAKGGHWEVLHRTENNGIELGEKLGGKLGEKLGKTRAAIVAAMKDDPKVTVIELAKLLGLSTTAIEKNIAFLKSHELVQRHGPAKGGHWEVLQ